MDATVIEDAVQPRSPFHAGQASLSQHIVTPLNRQTSSTHDLVHMSAQEEPLERDSTDIVESNSTNNPTSHVKSQLPNTTLPGVETLATISTLPKMEICSQTVPSLVHPFANTSKGTIASESSSLGDAPGNGSVQSGTAWPLKSPPFDSTAGGIPIGWSPLTAFFFKASGGLPSASGRLSTPRLPGGGNCDPLTPSLWLGNGNDGATSQGPGGAFSAFAGSTTPTLSHTGVTGALTAGEQKWDSSSFFPSAPLASSIWTAAATNQQDNLKITDASGHQGQRLHAESVNVAETARTTSDKHAPSRSPHSRYDNVGETTIQSVVLNERFAASGGAPPVSTPSSAGHRNIWRAPLPSWLEQEPLAISLSSIYGSSASALNPSNHSLSTTRCPSNGLSLAGTSQGWEISADAASRSIADASSYAHVRGSLASLGDAAVNQPIIGKPPVAARAPRSRRAETTSDNSFFSHYNASNGDKSVSFRGTDGNLQVGWYSAPEHKRFASTSSSLSTLSSQHTLSPGWLGSDDADNTFAYSSSAPTSSSENSGNENVYLSDASKWLAVQTRDPRASAAFFYCVLSTKIFCRTTCPSRRPIRENIFFVSSAKQAIALGYRACRRCKPDIEGGDPHEERQELLISQVKDRLMQGVHGGSNGKACKGKGLKYIAEDLGVSHWHLHRCFKKRVGNTPEAWAKLQAKRLRNSGGDLSLIDGRAGGEDEGNTDDASTVSAGSPPNEPKYVPSYSVVGRSSVAGSSTAGAEGFELGRHGCPRYDVRPTEPSHGGNMCAVESLTANSMTRTAL